MFSVISSDSQRWDNNARFTTVPLKALSGQEWIGIQFFFFNCLFSFAVFVYYAFRALRTHLLVHLWTCSLRIHCKTKTNKKFADFMKKFRGFQKFNSNQILLEAIFWNFDHPLTFSGVKWSPTQNLGPIGIIVLSFIEYKRTVKVKKDKNQWRNSQKLTLFE